VPPGVAWDSLSKLIKQMASNTGAAKGATETLAFIRNQLAAGRKIVGIEFKEEVLLAGGKRIREYDVLVELPDGKLLKYEVKAWRPDVLLDKLYLSFKGGSKDLATGRMGQLQTDLASAIKVAFTGGELTDLTKITNRWLFDARLGDEIYGNISKQDVIGGFIEKLREDPTMVNHLVNITGDAELLSYLKAANWNGAVYVQFIDSISEVLDHMIEINARIIPGG